MYKLIRQFAYMVQIMKGIVPTGLSYLILITFVLSHKKGPVGRLRQPCWPPAPTLAADSDNN